MAILELLNKFNPKVTVVNQTLVLEDDGLVVYEQTGLPCSGEDVLGNSILFGDPISVRSIHDGSVWQFSGISELWHSEYLRQIRRLLAKTRESVPLVLATGDRLAPISMPIFGAIIAPNRTFVCNRSDLRYFAYVESSTSMLPNEAFVELQAASGATSKGKLIRRPFWQCEPELYAIAEHWSWAGIDPRKLALKNSFGNLIVEDLSQRFWRLCPEELFCKVIAENLDELKATFGDPEFKVDWQMKALEIDGKAKFGELVEGHSFALITPGPLGGAYESQNLCVLDTSDSISKAGAIAEACWRAEKQRSQ